MKKLALIVLCFVLAGCSLPRGAAQQNEIIGAGKSEDSFFSVVPVTQSNFSAIDRWPTTGSAGNYLWPDGGTGFVSNLIETGDRLNVIIWDSEASSLFTSEQAKQVQIPDVKVSPNGSIFIPYINEIMVRGKTIDEARRDIQESLEVVVPSAQVQLSISEGQRNSVDVVHGVANPSIYPLPGRDFTILSLISAAGGIAQPLSNPVVKLIRGNSTFEIPAETLFADASKNIVLRGGDKVLVEEDKRYFVSLGAAQSEQVVYFEKESMNALEAISTIGGLSDFRADPKGVLVLREYEPSAVRDDGLGPSREQVVFTLDLTTADGLFAARNFEINSNDTVLATESPINAARTVIGLIGSLVGISNQVEN